MLALFGGCVGETTPHPERRSLQKQPVFTDLKPLDPRDPHPAHLSFSVPHTCMDWKQSLLLCVPGNTSIIASLSGFNFSPNA